MKLLLCTGHAWAATTPMYYTLGYYNKYCHTGHRKENGYLWQLYLEHIRDIKQVISQYRIIRKGLETHKGNHQLKLSPMPDDFSILDFYDRPFRIEKYIEYYKRVWDNVKNEYKAVADFSTHNAGLSEEYLYKIKPKLLEHFDIQVIMVFRDPVRRHWSENGGVHGNYAENYQKYCNVFGKKNVHYVIMEDFWSGETSELSEFLDYDIQQISENVYWPLDNTVKPEHLSDQWAGEKHLPLDMISLIREQLNPLYLQYEQIIGKIPERWLV
jgi:hypothetical protein|tara:strand:+ start:335 stop:1144 length:810 start_codon:yes stop_codon:yes gene_type:complete